MLTLNRRLCDLGGDQSSKTRAKDGETIRTLTFAIENYPLDEQELNAFLRDPHAWRWMYSDVNGEVKPVQTCFKSHELRKPISSAYLGVWYGLSGYIAFTDCKLTKIKLACKDDNTGETLLSCKVTTPPILNETLAELFKRFGTKVEVEIRGEPPGAQMDMPLNAHGAKDAPASKANGGAVDKPKPTDKTRVLAPGQAEREAEATRKLGEALRKQDADAEEKSKSGRKPRDTHAH